VHHLAVNFIVLNVFVDQVNVVLRLELSKPIKLRSWNLAIECETQMKRRIGDPVNIVIEGF
jgi:hypothetical protein